MQLHLSCLFVLLTLLSLGHAQSALIKWGELVEHIPTAVSHQSTTVVHSSVPQRTPLLTPAVRTFVVPLPLPFSTAATYVHSHAPSARRYFYTAPSSVNSYGN